MTPEQIALSRELVAALGTRCWAPGVQVVDPATGTVYGRCLGRNWPRGDEGFVPDLTDPATVGCLLAMLPFDARAGSLTYEPEMPRVEGLPDEPASWGVSVCQPGRGRHRVVAPTLGEAVARALLAVHAPAPGAADGA